MDLDEHYRGLERMYSLANCNAAYTNKVAIAKGEARLSLPVDERYFHAAGAVHGHLYFKMLDDAAYFAAASLVPGFFVVTVSFTTYLVRAIDKGTMIAHGTVMHQSSNLIIAESVVTDEAGKQIARGSGTFMKAAKKLGDVKGYSATS